MNDRYNRQDRGGQTAYDRYLRGMDASMRQKVALTAAHLLCEGTIADMGMGSGSGSFALASLYPELEVIGVDVDPEMVRRADERFQLPNLRFVEGDIAKPCFDESTLEAILDSSVLHHVTSYGGYDRGAAERALTVQAKQLADRGVLIVRDFLDPGDMPVWLDLPANDFEGSSDSDDPERCSTAALFERFAREFRKLRAEPSRRGFAYERIDETADPPLAEGWRRYALSHRHAVEFVLRKDYRASWDVEVQEEYTFATQRELEAIFARLELRVLASTPIRNPWIVAHRLVGKLRLWRAPEKRDASAEPLDHPATNYVIVGQKVPPGEGVRIVEKGPHDTLGYLELTHHRRASDGRIFDLARRPGVTVDVLPWFRKGGPIFVMARRSYPRPVLGCRLPGWVPMDGASLPSYVTEPLNVLREAEPLGQSVESLLAGFPSLGGDGIYGMDRGSIYYPSPGGIQEQVESVMVQVAASNVQTRIVGSSGFSTNGVLRAIEARQLLRAAQVGGLPDARLELNTYQLLAQQDEDPGAWIGESIQLEDGPAPDELTSLDDLLARPHRRLFRRATLEESGDFLEVRSACFAELDAEGKEVASQARELVLPRIYSINTVAVAPLRLHRGTILIGLDDDDLPAAQCFRGNSEILVAPAWRIPHDVTGIEATRGWIRERLREDYGTQCTGMWELGGRYLPSAGLTPEVVYPLAVQLREVGRGNRQLRWIPLAQTVSSRAALRDGHLRIVSMRAAHALGLLA